MNEDLELVQPPKSEHFNTKLKAPFPYFGGKSRCADKVWQALGDPKNYIEPFSGSAAVLFRRPGTNHKYYAELINDYGSRIVNVWRSIRQDPEQVVHEIKEHPFSEVHLRAIQKAVFEADLTKELQQDVDFFDARQAAMWIWGACMTVGSDFREGGGKACLRTSGYGSGVTRMNIDLMQMVQDLSNRLQRVKIICGDFEKCFQSNSKLFAGSTTVYKDGKNHVGIFLDPPYDSGMIGVYDEEKGIFERALDAFVELGQDSRIRAALCGYNNSPGVDRIPDSWMRIDRKEQGGYGNQNADGNKNSDKEVIWFSPSCLEVEGQYNEQ